VTPASVSAEIRGLGVSAGSVVGPVVRVNPPVPVPADEPVAIDAVAATEAAGRALESVAVELERRAGLAFGDGAAVLGATAMMARDPALLKDVGKKLELGSGPATAIDAAIREFVVMFIAAGGYLAERATDLLDVRDRAVARLLGLPDPGLPPLDSPAFIVARDLAPSETAILDPALVLALVTEAGGPTSHTAILAAELGIPAVVHATGVLEIEPGTVVAVDGTSGLVVIAPSAQVRSQFEARTRRRAAMLRQGGGPGLLADGSAVSLYANVGTVSDAEHAGASDVEGVGLFRTEFMFLDRATAPSLDEQILSYSTVFEAFGSRPVTVRTLDAGADKPMRFAAQEAEENPALGVRGLRLSQRRTDLLQTQLKAIAAAVEKTGAHARVMAPMVATSDEAAWFADQAHSAGLTTVGVMIEVPSAALRARHVLAPVDFASIGTNDLTQYVMAADRMSGGLAALLDVWQPAVLDLIAATSAGAARSAGSPVPMGPDQSPGVGSTAKPVGVCGEAAGDPLIALVLVGLGISSLSMAVPKIPAVRLALSLHDRATCVAMAEAARGSATAAAAHEAALRLAHADLRALL
jgi:phosphoenolpyruvate-protein phosphotransferase (PTS system enzyme I)